MFEIYYKYIRLVFKAISSAYFFLDALPAILVAITKYTLGCRCNDKRAQGFCRVFIGVSLI